MRGIKNLPTLFLPIFLSLLTANPTNGAKILFFLGIGSSSHRVAMQPLATRLSEVGHEVTVLSHIKPVVPNPKIKEFFPESAAQLLSTTLGDISVDAIQGRLKEKYYDPFLVPHNVWEYAITGQATTVRSPEFKEWIKTAKFDLIIYDSPLREIAHGIAYKMGAKVIAYCTFATFPMGNFDLFGLPIETSWHPDFTMGSDYPFIPDHFIYSYNALRWYFSQKWYYIHQVDGLLKELYNEDLPPIDELIRKVDLIFVNEHFSASFPRALPPYVVPIGGTFCKDSNGVLPKEMEAFVKTKEKFMFFSFGSAIKVSALPVETQQMLFRTVEAIEDTNFLWKWEGEIPSNLPKNVYALNWFPQQDVLAHPKCRGFVTQGGVMSYQQASYHGVPMVVIPIWSDQNYVGKSAEYRGNGVMLELSEITQETFTRALREILDNESYYKSAQEVAKRFKDRPLSPLDTAVWWTEYVLRHDTAHLRSPGVNQYWWQRRLLDFWAAVLVSLLILLFVIFKIIKVVVKLLLRLRSSSKVKTS